MDLKQLRYFLAIVEEGSLSRAAHRLGVAQPALSQHVRRLEEDLGVTLLVRGARGVHPTEPGERLADDARMILRHMEWAREHVRGVADPPAGPVTVGMPPSVAMVLTVPLVEAVRARLPEVSLRLVESLSGDVSDWLSSGRLDLGVLYNAENQRGVSSEFLVNEEIDLISPVAAKVPPGPVRFADLPKYQLILPGRRHGLRRMIEDKAREQNVTLNVVAEVDGMMQIRALVARGVGHTLLSQSAMHDEVALGRITARPVTEPTLSRSLSVCNMTHRPLSSAARAVRDTVVAVVRDMVAREVWPGEAA